jgi:histidine triad (HIT) family protein
MDPRIDTRGLLTVIGCPFCEIIAGAAPATVIRQWPNAIAIVPLEPVTDGHTLVIPTEHATDFSASSEALFWALMCAAQLAREMPGDMNLITSRGPAATQTVPHLHLHLIPRREGDGLKLPWTEQQATPA